MNFWAANQKKEADEEFVKNQQRVQEYINKFGIPNSREITTTKKKQDVVNSEWQGYSWVNKATEVTNDRATRYSNYRDMCRVPELNTGLNVYADNCLHPDTIINTLKGDFTIKELCEMYPNGETFEVWSYNLDKKRVDIGLANHPRMTQKNAKTYKISFDDGSFIIATDNHPILLRSGEYKEVQYITIGDRVMPFNKKISSDKHIRVSTMSKGQQYAHQYVWYLLNNEEIKRPYCIHHINENKEDNSPKNLVKMTIKEHSGYHASLRWKTPSQLKKICDYYNSNKTLNESRKEKIVRSWTEERRLKHSLYIKELYVENNILKDKVKHVGSDNGRYLHNITSELVLNASKKYRRLSDVSKALNCDSQVISRRIKEMGYSSYEELKLNNCLNFLVENKESNNIASFAQNSPYSKSYLFQVVKHLGFKNWEDFKKNYENHAVISVEYYGMSDVYDLTVDNFHNFSANGVFVHNCTQYDIQKNVLTIQSENNKVIEILERLFFDTLNINTNLWKIARNTCTLGDEFREIITDNIHNPKHIVALERVKKPEKMKRIEQNGKLEKFVYIEENEDEEETTETTFLPWKIVHFRIEDEEYDPYGKSLLESGRRIWKKLSLMEDAMLIYRISRAPERRVFYIDVGTLSSKEANQYIDQIKSKFKKKNYINPSTGEVDQKADALGITEDFYIPVRQNSQGTRIDTLPAGTQLGEIDDTLYFKNQLLKLLGVPVGYLGGESTVQYDPKAYLSQQEIQFSRAAERIQKYLIKGLEKVAIIELVLNGIKGDDLKQFKIVLTPPSNVDQLMELEVRTQEFTLIQMIKSLSTDPNAPPFLPDSWIYKNVLGFTDQQVNKIRLQSQMQAQMALQVQQMAGGGAGAAAGGVAGAAAGSAGGNIMPTETNTSAGGMAGGSPETPAGSEAGTSAAPAPGLDIAGKQFVEFDGGKWLMENAADMKNLLKYVQLYEESAKQDTPKKKLSNGSVYETIKGELGGLMKAVKNSDDIFEIVKISEQDFNKYLTESSVPVKKPKENK